MHLMCGGIFRRSEPRREKAVKFQIMASVATTGTLRSISIALFAVLDLWHENAPCRDPLHTGESSKQINGLHHSDQKVRHKL